MITNLKLNLENKQRFVRKDNSGVATFLATDPTKDDYALFCFNMPDYQNIVWLNKEYFERKYGKEAATKVFG